MTRISFSGSIDDVDVTIVVDGPEDMANRVSVDLKGRADELNQMIEHGIPPEETTPPMSIRWSDVLDDVEGGSA